MSALTDLRPAPTAHTGTGCARAPGLQVVHAPAPPPGSCRWSVPVPSPRELQVVHALSPPRELQVVCALSPPGSCKGSTWWPQLSMQLPSPCEGHCAESLRLSPQLVAIWLEGGWRGAFSQGPNPKALRTTMVQGEESETPAPQPPHSSTMEPPTPSTQQHHGVSAPGRGA